ncbi:TetR/AcrR family transcriptional regulator [Aureispira sp. CCB-E]|uniref:TetR/AcrR family transcriptional regulator n=1 Tax=Aureispira sp. CCB-E TaxID=3051121 RepID=UPI002868AEEC|nr:TetR/AcrR family transcriptional regulator [Aureispira sp. CCB-E]WMX15333.1 TetR/AcrR family transcriptional regulator [Aureispira sp. CCB-E]
MTKKDNILNAGVQLLANNGIHATPMSAIAKSAKTGMGTIYNYFDNKEILINAIYVDIKEKEAAILAPVDVNAPIKTQFEAYYIAVVQFYIKNPAYYKFMEQLQGSPIITSESKNIGYQTIEPVVKTLQTGQQERIIKSIELEELLQFLGGSIFSFVKWYHTTTSSQKNTSLKNQLQMVWDAIKE